MDIGQDELDEQEIAPTFELLLDGLCDVNKTVGKKRARTKQSSHSEKRRRKRRKRQKIATQEEEDMYFKELDEFKKAEKAQKTQNGQNGSVSDFNVSSPCRDDYGACDGADVDGTMSPPSLIEVKKEPAYGNDEYYTGAGDVKRRGRGRGREQQQQQQQQHSMSDFMSPASSRGDAASMISSADAQQQQQQQRQYGGLFSDFSECSDVGGVGSGGSGGSRHGRRRRRLHSDFSNDSISGSDSCGSSSSGEGGEGGEGRGRRRAVGDGDLDIEGDDSKWILSYPPDTRRVLKLLGKPQPQSQCFGCRSGSKTVAAPCMESTDQLIDIFRRNQHQTDPVELTMQLYTAYETRIRQVANRNITDHEKLLPEWTPATIYVHFMKLDGHMNEPSIKFEKLSRRLWGLLDMTVDNSVERAVGPGGEDVYRLRKKRHKNDRDCLRDIKELVAMLKSVHSVRPELMLGHSKEISLHGIDKSAINPDRNWRVRNAPRHLYNNKRR